MVDPYAIAPPEKGKATCDVFSFFNRGVCLGNKDIVNRK